MECSGQQVLITVPSGHKIPFHFCFRFQLPREGHDTFLYNSLLANGAQSGCAVLVSSDGIINLLKLLF